MSYMQKRLIHHQNEIKTNPLTYCYAAPANEGEDLTNWIGYIDGPDDSPYQGGRFHLKIDFPSDYPFRPPHIHFTTQIYHPNISLKGEICLDLLHTQWSPALSIRALLISLCSLLTDPNIEHGLNQDALKLYRTNRNQYDENVRFWVKKYSLKTI